MPGDLTRDDVCGTVLAAYREVVGGEPPHGLDTVPGHVGDWDSLAQVRLVHAVEQSLGCVLDERYLTAGSTLAELVAEASAAAGAGTAA